MSTNNDSISKTIIVAFLVCLVCSIVVSGAAVALKDKQVANKTLDMQKNILAAAGLLEDGTDITEAFKAIEPRLVDMSTGQFVDDLSSIEGIGPNIEKYDQRKAKKAPALSERLSADADIAGLKRRANYSKVYLVKDENDALKTVILPISGYGLWSTLYGFVALDSDLNTVVGLGFYDHAETPGLGGEVDNPRWKAQWVGKQIYAEDGSVAAKLKKGTVDSNIEAEKLHQVDGLSGATLTSNGVSNLVRFWLGENGFAPLIANIKMSGV